MIISAEAKMKLVKGAMDAILYEHNEEATRANFSKDFIQHNPMSADGIDHLVAMTKFTFVWEHARWVVDGDIVAYHGLYSSSNPLAPDSPLLCVDMWRIDGEKIVEHWDALQVHPLGELASLIAGKGNGLKAGTDIDKNKKVVTSFMTAINTGNLDALKGFVSDDFVHHSAEGNKGVGVFSKEELEVKKIIGSGDLVLVHSKYNTSKKAAFDWFRCQGGKVAEHWIVTQDIAEETDNPHPHF